MEALQFLCKTSQQSRDYSYLLGIIDKIKSAHGHEKYIEYVKNALKEIEKSP
jgi:hypothetical protein